MEIMEIFKLIYSIFSLSAIIVSIISCWKWTIYKIKKSIMEKRGVEEMVFSRRSILFSRNWIISDENSGTTGVKVSVIFCKKRIRIYRIMLIISISIFYTTSIIMLLLLDFVF